MRTNNGLDWQAGVMANVSSQPAPGNYIALTADATAPAVTDSSLTGEYTTLGLSRMAATYAHTSGTSTYTLTATWTASGTATINKQGVFNAASSGTMIFESLEPTTATVVNTDTFTSTTTVTF